MPEDGDVERLATGLTDSNEVTRLHAMAGLVRHPHHPKAIEELLESAKNDMLGELAIVAAVALAEMQRSNPAILHQANELYRDTIGSRALVGGYDPTRSG